MNDLKPELHFPELVFPAEKMNDNKLYKVIQKEYMYNSNGDIIGSIDIRFQIINGELVVIEDDSNAGELLELDFRKNKDNEE